MDGSFHVNGSESFQGETSPTQSFSSGVDIMPPIGLSDSMIESITKTAFTGLQSEHENIYAEAQTLKDNLVSENPPVTRLRLVVKPASETLNPEF